MSRPPRYGDHIVVKRSGRYLGQVTDVRTNTVRFDGPMYPAGSLAGLHEIQVVKTRKNRKP